MYMHIGPQACKAYISKSFFYKQTITTQFSFNENSKTKAKAIFSKVSKKALSKTADGLMYLEF